MCHLRKILYVLKNTPRAWFGRFIHVITQFSMCQSKKDHSVFYQRTLAGRILLDTFLDDIVIMGDDSHGIGGLKKFMKE